MFRVKIKVPFLGLFFARYPMFVVLCGRGISSSLPTLLREIWMRSDWNSQCGSHNTSLQSWHLYRYPGRQGRSLWHGSWCDAAMLGLKMRASHKAQIAFSSKQHPKKGRFFQKVITTNLPRVITHKADGRWCSKADMWEIPIRTMHPLAAKTWCKQYEHPRLNVHSL